MMLYALNFLFFQGFKLNLWLKDFLCSYRMMQWSRTISNIFETENSDAVGLYFKMSPGLLLKRSTKCCNFFAMQVLLSWCLSLIFKVKAVVDLGYQLQTFFLACSSFSVIVLSICVKADIDLIFFVGVCYRSKYHVIRI